MRAGLFGALSSEALNVPGTTLRAEGEWNVVLGEVGCPHPVQGSVLRDQGGRWVGLHGAWLNPPTSNWSEELSAEVVQEVVSSPEAFERAEGPLQGCCWDARSSTFLLHGDFARQHPLYWTAHDKGMLFANSVDKLVELMRSLSVPVVPDQGAAAMLLTYGCILGDQTLIQGVRKIMPGHSLTWTPQGIQVGPRSSLLHIPRDLNREEETTQALDASLRSSIRCMAELNRRSGCRQHTLLSGGLDSRLVTFALSDEVSEVEALCFSARGYLDHHISETLAGDLGWGYHFCDLGTGEYMMETDSVMEYDGCVNYLASAHHRHALEQLEPEALGLLGSGQGANVLLTDAHSWDASGEDALRSMELYSGVRSHALSSAMKAWDQHPHPQVFKVINRGFLYTNSGAYSTASRGVLWSPFTSRAFVRTALRVSREHVAGQRAYLTWMASRFPDALNYDWERYGVPPVLGWRLRMAQVWAKLRAKLGRWIPSWAPASMSPIQDWHDKSPRIQDFYRQTFQDHQAWLGLYPSLQSMVERDYDTMTVMNKASVVTLLLASKSWFKL